ncbi:LysR family transcriptional regulator [Clostridium omnivorum]|uniref:LysR family transcriptional regulator n=1 Tax=Clostridium omnivorum TaxID=1604902 RepID=A0ABQ5N0T3_9CLOT|nr:LysR family transcriptional regulator [Clostridium sp. E14]GLC28815.1 LysR family transcriptional regulator [Clostridium sp. E14]
MLDVRLKTFITLVQLKSFTRTAEALNLTQPAVSQHIRFLEEYYEVKLIKKEGRMFSITKEGMLLMKYSKELEEIYSRMELELKKESKTKKVHEIGATLTIGGYILPNILGMHKNLNPTIDILLQVNNTEEIIHKLINKKIELALVEGPFDRKIFKHIKIKNDELVLAVSPKHEFALKEQIDIDEIINGKLILREKGSGTRKVFENSLKERGYDIEDIFPYMEVGDISAIKSLVESNLGYTIISKETIKGEIDRGTIVTVPINDMKIYREFNFIYLEDTRFIMEFIKFSLQNIILS